MRMYERLLVNDQFMHLGAIIAIWLIVCKKSPLSSCLMLSVALSIKSGIMLYLPAFLGSLQYMYGIKTLVFGFTIIIAF